MILEVLVETVMSTTRITEDTIAVDQGGHLGAPEMVAEAMIVVGEGITAMTVVVPLDTMTGTGTEADILLVEVVVVGIGIVAEIAVVSDTLPPAGVPRLHLAATISVTTRGDAYDTFVA